MAKTAVKTAQRTKSKAITAMAKTSNRYNERVPAPTQRALDVFVEPSDTDVNGSYTGRPKNKREKPVQDADDL